MTEEDVKHIIYGIIRELTQHNRYFDSGYRCHFTEEGKKVIIASLDMYAPHILDAISHDDIARSKQIVLKGLKGEKI